MAEVYCEIDIIQQVTNTINSSRLFTNFLDWWWIMTSHLDESYTPCDRLPRRSCNFCPCGLCQRDFQLHCTERWCFQSGDKFAFQKRLKIWKHPEALLHCCLVQYLLVLLAMTITLKKQRVRDSLQTPTVIFDMYIKSSNGPKLPVYTYLDAKNYQI